MEKNIGFIDTEVISNREIVRGTGIYWLGLVTTPGIGINPGVGQFMMIESLAEGSILSRPFSIALCNNIRNDVSDIKRSEIHFCYNIRGKNTAKLSSLVKGETIRIKGPFGQPFKPIANANKYVIVAGGMGLMVFMQIARELKTECQEVDLLFGSKNNLRMVAEILFRGLVNEKNIQTIVEPGLVTTLLEKKLSKAEETIHIIACGPAEMLAKVSEIAEWYNCHVLVGLEKVMACGYGACLGCQVQMKNGEIKRVCSDGPFLDGRAIDWPVFLKSLPPKESVNLMTISSSLEGRSPRLEQERYKTWLVNRNGQSLELPFPFMNASGTQTYKSLMELDTRYLGAVVTKGVSLEPWSGNPLQRICEVRGGLINSIGLENSGLKIFIDKELPVWQSFGLPVIVNIWGKTVVEYIAVARGLAKCQIAGVEINLSCPNIEAGGMQFGKSLELIRDIVKQVRQALPDKIFVFVKFGIESEYEEGSQIAFNVGADGVTLINTVRSMKINTDTWQIELQGKKGGMSGPNIHPAAVMALLNVAELPIIKIGAGGIETSEDALEFMLAGASAVQIGTAAMNDPGIFTKLKIGLEKYMDKMGIAQITQIIKGAIK